MTRRLVRRDWASRSDHRAPTVRDQAAAAHFEALEPRRLLAINFASVGLLYVHEDGSLGAETFSTEGRIEDDGSATGEMFESGRLGPVSDQGLRYNRVTVLPDGRFVRSPNRGRLREPDETNGAWFGTSDVGWFYSQRRRRSSVFDTEFSQEIEYIVERPESATLADIEGVWRFSLVGVDFDADEPFNGTGTLTISGSTIRWRVEVGSAAREMSVIESVAEMGEFITSDDETFYLSRDGQTLIFADLGELDDLVFAGVAVRADAAATPQALAGGYLLSWAVAGEPAFDIRDEGDLAFAQRFLELEPDGDFVTYDLDLYDDGVRRPITRGTWSVQGNQVLLDVRGTDEILAFTISDGGNELLNTTWDDAEFIDAVVGLAIRVGGPEITGTLISVAADTPGGAEAVYALRGANGTGAGGGWFVSDLVAVSGSPAIADGVVTWEDPKTGGLFAAGHTENGEVILFTQNSRGRWTFRNLSTETPGSQRITRGMGVMITPDRVVNLTGLNGEGDVVRFFQTGKERNADDGGGFVWGVMNITDEQLTPTGQATPRFTGDLESFATSWGGLNIVGLGPTGEIFSVWWAPGLATWQVTNLSQRYNAPVLAGGLTTFLTPWDSINIGGVTASGEFEVAWWLPEFGDHWERSNLTEQAGGPLLRAEDDLAAFVSLWGGMNVAGVSLETGEVVNYWWAPGIEGNRWSFVVLDGITPGDQPRLTGPLTGVAGEDLSLSVFGFDPEGELVRFFWEPGFGGEWRFENVHEMATVVT